MPKTIRLVITGLQQSGKSVFITTLINNLVYAHEQLNQSPELRERGLTLIGSLRKTAGPAHMRLFPFRRYLESLRRDPPEWPSKTFDLSGCTVNVEYGVKSGFGELGLEIVDYPGERILDLGMMKQDFRTWSEQQIDKSASEERFQSGGGPVCRRELSEGWRAALDRYSRMDKSPQAAAFDLVSAYKAYQGKCLDAGMEFVQPSVVALEHFAAHTSADYHPYPLDFCPLPTDWAESRNTRRLYRNFQRHFDKYLEEFVAPFYEELTRADAQIVLIDALRVLQRGVQSFNDVQELIDVILENYTYRKDVSRISWRRPGRKLAAYLEELGSRPIRKTIFAATKADLVTRDDRPRLAELVRQIVYKWLKRFEITASEDYTQVTFCAANGATEDGYSSKTEQAVLQATVLEDAIGRECVYIPPAVPAQWPDEEWDISQYVYPWKVLPRKLPARDGAAINNIGLTAMLLEALKGSLPAGKGSGGGDGANVQ